MPRPPAPKPKAKQNPLRNHRPINAPIALQRQAVTANTNVTTLPLKRACPNKECSAPDVQEGVCHNCGTIVDDSNIVSEVTFGESSSGAAVVQGSYVGADQSTARSLGPAFRRAGGGEDRESTVRNGKLLMTGLANQLGVNAPIIETATQIFKLASQNNFIQGRRMDMVAAVCLYTACRKTRPCTVMLIDFADKVQVNVFKLGHTFKDLHQTITLTADGMQPILPEDLIYRFANKLEFGDATGKVAEDAVRLVNRMSLDWMVVGRRPSGVCGACLILAARMNNFRRTISELVYIVKVTNHTIQKRLDEFKMTPSSGLSVADFLNNEFLSSHHDPPAFYEQTDEYQKTKKRRKKKPTYNGVPPQEEDEHRDKRQKTTTRGPEPPIEPLRIDADGFAIPPAPVHVTEASSTANIDPNLDPMLTNAPITNPNIAPVRSELVNDTETDSDTALIDPNLEASPAPDLVDEAMADSSFGAAFSQLVSRISDEVAPRGSAPLDDGDDDAASIFPDVYASVEESQPIDETIADPHTFTHAAAFLKAQELARRHIAIADAIRPPQNVSMAIEIGEDEFDSDPEVANCLLSEADSALKETVWVNENKKWLLTQQQKEYERKQAESGPPKARRNRKKKPRIGEGQETAASSPHEATLNMLKARTVSKKIDYSAMNPMFDRIAQFGTFGSASTSRHTSRAGSISSSRESSLAPSESDSGSVAGSVMSEGNPRAPLLLIGARKTLTTEERREKRKQAKARKDAAAAEASEIATPRPVSASQSESGDAEDDEGDPDDYVEPDPIAADDDIDVEGEGWKDALGMAGKASLGNMGEDGQFVEDDDDGGDNYVGGEEEEDYGDFDPDAIGGGDEDEY